MNRAQRRAQKAAPMSFSAVMRRCRFRTLLGCATKQPSLVLAVVGGQPAPLTAEMMVEVVALLAGGGTALLVSDRADLRDRAKREIVAAAGPAMGSC